MAGDIFRFYRACAARAFEGWFKRVEGWASTLALLIAILLLFVALPPELEKIVQTVPTWFFLAVFLCAIIFRLILAPYQLFNEERVARETLERKRRPALEIGLPEPPVIQSISLRGGTSESLAGSRQTVVNGWELDVVALMCINRGEETAMGCRARLMSVTRMEAGGDEILRVVSPVLLPWEKEAAEDHLVANLAPNEEKRIWVGGVRSHGHIWLFRDTKNLPIEYQQLLGEAGTYRLLIQLDGDNIPPQQIEIQIIAAEGPKPERGIQRGKVEVSIHASGAPCVEPAEAT